MAPLPSSKIAKRLNKTEDKMRLDESLHILERDSQFVFFFLKKRPAKYNKREKMA